MGSKRSVYLSDRSIEVLGEQVEPSYSGRLNQCIDRYGEFLALERRDLRKVFSSSDLEALRLVARDDLRSSLPAALAHVLTGRITDESGVRLTEKKASALLDKISSLRPSQIIALAEQIDSPHG